MFADVAHQFSAQILHGSEDAAAHDVSLNARNQFSTWFSHEEFVGVKCICTLRCAEKKSATHWVSWLPTLSQMT